MKKVTVILLVSICLYLVVISEACAGHGKKNKVGKVEFQNTTSLIEAHGYPTSQYTAITHDGYHLGLFRIPNPGKPAVLLQHGFLDTSSAFVLGTPTNSLGFILHDAGYDVYLCNHRGNRYSLEHELYSSLYPAFWDFSWDHHASGDIPACINSVLQLSQTEQLYYIGHSQGATTAFAEFSRLPETWARKVKLFIAMAPIVFLGHEDSPLLRTMANSRVDERMKTLADGQFFLTPQAASVYLAKECTTTPSLCNDILGSLTGESGLLDKKQVSRFLEHWPDTTSRQNVLHWIQNSRQGNFADFNGTTYDVAQLQIPTAIFCGSGDALADSQDCNTLIHTLSKQQKLVYQQLNTFSHMDFVWAESATFSVYSKIVQLLRNH